MLVISIIQGKPRDELAKMVHHSASFKCICPRTNRTPLEFAVNENDHCVIKDLINLHADVYVKIPGGHTASKWSSSTPHTTGRRWPACSSPRARATRGVREAVGLENIRVIVQYWLDQVPVHIFVSPSS